MEAGKSQKILKVASIIQIVLSIISVLGLMALAMSIGVITTEESISQELASSLDGSGVSVEQIASQVNIAIAINAVGALIALIAGFLGIGASANPQKIMPVWVLSIVLVLINAVALVQTFAQMAGSGSFSFTTVVSALAGLILPALCLWAANNIRRELKREPEAEPQQNKA